MDFYSGNQHSQIAEAHFALGNRQYHLQSPELTWQQFMEQAGATDSCRCRYVASYCKIHSYFVRGREHHRSIRGSIGSTECSMTRNYPSCMTKKSASSMIATGPRTTVPASCRSCSGCQENGLLLVPQKAVYSIVRGTSRSGQFNNKLHPTKLR